MLCIYNKLKRHMTYYTQLKRNHSLLTDGSISIAQHFSSLCTDNTDYHSHNIVPYQLQNTMLQRFLLMLVFYVLQTVILLLHTSRGRSMSL